MLGWGIMLIAVSYLLVLFVVASIGDRRRRNGAVQKSRPAIYALSLAIYCTSWTFFGSVGLASSTGLNFLAIYLGPVLMITLAFPLFRHIIDVSKSERITSIADFIASRYGKSTAVGAVAAIIAVLGTVPYIALQLKAISNSVTAMVSEYEPSLLGNTGSSIDTSLSIAILLALFAMLFGTRHADATEHQEGLMLAIATESIVKLLAFLAVGFFVLFVMFDGPGDLLAQARRSEYVQKTFYAGINPGAFFISGLLSFFAFVLLPRQFHVGVVENHSADELKTARWMFPGYLVLINLFVVPVAIAGMLKFGASVDADNFVLALPLSADAYIVSPVVFIGGLSAATAMVIVGSVALAIMISNNIVLPLILRHRNRGSNGRSTSRAGDMTPLLLTTRRTAIFGIVALAYAYFQIAGDSAALASIGLLSFAAVAQFAPSFFGGLVWRRGTARGAIWGMCAGFGVWFYTLFLPTILAPDGGLMMSGPFDIAWLHPQKLLGTNISPLNHGVMFSLLVNVLFYMVGSYTRSPRSIERMQANTFFVRRQHQQRTYLARGSAISNAELKGTVSNYLGYKRCERSFHQYFAQRNAEFDPRELADDELIQFSEQLLASAIGAASSRLVISLLLRKHQPVEETTIQLLDDASEALQYNRDLLQTAINQVEQGICVFDKEFRLSSWNTQFRALLHLPGNMGQVGMQLATLAEAIEKISEPHRKGGSDFASRLLDIDRPWQITLSKSKRIIEVHTKAMPNGGLVISWNDITQRVKAARALQTANETLEKRVRERTEELTRLNDDLAQARETAEVANIGKTKFLAAVGHDILQPLNAARLYTSTLVEQSSDKRTKGIARNVDDALESVEDILGAVLAISRLDSGVLTPNFTTFPVAQLLKRLETEFSPIAESKNLHFEVTANHACVKSDYGLLRRLLQNLVSNAIKYTAKGSVRVEASVDDDMVVFNVSDTGPGISEAEKEVIFDEFRRLEAGKKAAPGLGLGLSIVRRLATTLDHEISFDSPVGKGSTFFVKVPLALPDNQSAGDQGFAATPADEAPFSNVVVVCIDNDRRILDGMQNLLGGWGCEVHTFDGSRELMPRLDNLKPHILLADYHLDHETGFDVIEAVRSKLGGEFPAVLITADRSASVRELAKACDVTLLTKPLKPAALRTLFTRQLASRGGGASQAAE